MFRRFSKMKTDFKVKMLTLCVAAFMAMATAVGAEADTATVTSITTTFTSVKDTGLAALAAVAGVAILLFAGIYAWKYGKKVFSIIAK